LISFLVYLAILHGRYAGWFGNFGLIVGSTLGALAITFSWYGVNFILDTGLHSYGSGAGGQGYVISASIANILLLGAAAARYAVETAAPGQSQSEVVQAESADAAPEVEKAEEVEA
jgi:hypothetical protein